MRTIDDPPNMVQPCIRNLNKIILCDPCVPMVLHHGECFLSLGLAKGVFVNDRIVPSSLEDARGYPGLLVAEMYMLELITKIELKELYLEYQPSTSGKCLGSDSVSKQKSSRRHTGSHRELEWFRS
jgi:hypothetical protein